MPHSQRIILPQQAFNCVPTSRTPWGGSLIPQVKGQLKGSESLPPRVGESWEVSTGNPFPSRLRDAWENHEAGTPLEVVMESNPHILGSGVHSQWGSHCPLLLKWIHAQDVLSLQVHPARGDERLPSHQDGKPESWLVMATEEHAEIFLGFREGPSKEEIVECFRSGRESEVLYRFRPEPKEHICVPAGCVHAIGPGVLLAEAQYCSAQKEGVTLRVSDWGRTYNSSGEIDPQGQPRETHFDRAVETIDWNLPRGEELRKKLCRKLENSERYFPPAATPFPVRLFCEPGDYLHTDLVKDTFSAITVWAGTATLSTGMEEITIQAGESAFLAPHRDPLNLRLSPTDNGSPEVGAALFSIQP